MLGNEGMILRRQTMHSAGFRDTDGMIQRHHYFEFDVNNTQTIGGQFSTIAGKEISVDWGDGSARSTYSGINQAWTKDYGSAGDRTVRIFGSVVLTKFMMSAGGANISFDVANLPAGVTYLYVTGSNTVTGDIGNLPAGVTVLQVTGSNSLSGDIGNLPAGLTYLYMLGNNSLSGNIGNLPAGVAYLRVTGNNTVTGDIGNLPAGVTYLQVTGNNTIADYTTKLWTTKPTFFYHLPVGAGGLSEAEIDQLFIDFDDDLVWAAGNVITLTGTNAAPSAASAAARTNIANEGCTITTN